MARADKKQRTQEMQMDELEVTAQPRSLPDELGKRLRPKRGVLVLRLALGGERGVIGHSAEKPTSSSR